MIDTVKIPAELKKIKLSAGMYDDAATQGGFNAFLEKHFVDKEKVMAATPYYGRDNFQIQAMKAAYAASGQVVPLTALEMAVAAHGITLNGSSCSTMDAFKQDASTMALLPGVILDMVFAAALKEGLASVFCPNRVTIPGTWYVKIKDSSTKQNRSFARGSAYQTGGTEHKFPEARLIRDSEQGTLKDFGRELTYSYNDIDSMPVSMFRQFIERRFSQLGIDMTDWVLQQAYNNVPAAHVVDVSSTGSIDIEDIIKFSATPGSPYKITEAAARTAAAVKWWGQTVQLTQGKAQRGEINVPIPNLNQWDDGPVPANFVLAMDPRHALTMYSNDFAVMEETEKVITAQKVVTVISIRMDVDVTDANALVSLDVAP